MLKNLADWWTGNPTSASNLQSAMSGTVENMLHYTKNLQALLTGATPPKPADIVTLLGTTHVQRGTLPIAFEWVCKGGPHSLQRKDELRAEFYTAYQTLLATLLDKGAEEAAVGALLTERCMVTIPERKEYYTHYDGLTNTVIGVLTNNSFNNGVQKSRVIPAQRVSVEPREQLQPSTIQCFVSWLETRLAPYIHQGNLAGWQQSGLRQTYLHLKNDNQTIRFDVLAFWSAFIFTITGKHPQNAFDQEPYRPNQFFTSLQEFFNKTQNLEKTLWALERYHALIATSCFLSESCRDLFSTLLRAHPDVSERLFALIPPKWTDVNHSDHINLSHYVPMLALFEKSQLRRHKLINAVRDLNAEHESLIMRLAIYDSYLQTDIDHRVVSEYRTLISKLAQLTNQLPDDRPNGFSQSELAALQKNFTLTQKDKDDVEDCSTNRHLKLITQNLLRALRSNLLSAEEIPSFVNWYSKKLIEKAIKDDISARNDTLLCECLTPGSSLNEFLNRGRYWWWFKPSESKTLKRLRAEAVKYGVVIPTTNELIARARAATVVAQPTEPSGSASSTLATPMTPSSTATPAAAPTAMATPSSSASIALRSLTAASAAATSSAAATTPAADTAEPPVAAATTSLADAAAPPTTNVGHVTIDIGSDPEQPVEGADCAEPTGERRAYSV